MPDLCPSTRFYGTSDVLYPNVQNFIKFHLFEPQMETDKY